jgi:glycosyltransferase involved in cell wall biosynthesis
MRISFCTTCMGRAHHLKETLPSNLAYNLNADTEFVVLNYNSKDGLHEWLQQLVTTNPLASRVAYFHERTAQFFDPRHAKNIAHLLATGDVVVNIDADNSTGHGYDKELSDIFAKTGRAVVTSDLTLKSVTGKIAMLKRDFIELRGYDESFRGWGGEDPDLIKRAVAARFPHIAKAWPGEAAIRHSNADRVVNMEVTDEPKVSSLANRKIMRTRARGAVVNPAGFGRATVFRGFTDDAVTVGVR